MQVIHSLFIFIAFACFIFFVAMLLAVIVPQSRNWGNRHIKKGIAAFVAYWVFLFASDWFLPKNLTKSDVQPSVAINQHNIATPDNTAKDIKKHTASDLLQRFTQSQYLTQDERLHVAAAGYDYEKWEKLTPKEKAQVFSEAQKLKPLPAADNSQPSTKSNDLALTNGQSGKKLDLVGFMPGMDEADAKRLGAGKSDCTDDDTSLVGYRSGYCFEGIGKIVLNYTEGLETTKVASVELNFISGLPPKKMIAYVSNQFHVKPVKPDWTAEIDNADVIRPTTVGDKVYNVIGGNICEWYLGEGLHLKLELGVHGLGEPNHYTLSLTSDAIAQELLRAAGKKFIDNMNINTKPKF
jgi:hypothetical protein